jgi:hypothetical protein
VAIFIVFPKRQQLGLDVSKTRGPVLPFGQNRPLWPIFIAQNQKEPAFS